VSDQRDTYEATKARLEEISAAARAKDVTLEKSIELLEEAVRLANLCTEHVDQVETFSAADEPAIKGAEAEASPAEPAGDLAEVPEFVVAPDPAAGADGDPAGPEGATPRDEY
jgi:exodeoxyribonuclease VII small subunit